ncbi:MAG TPA: 2Fe-2S iron-sulfur cluster-binding protein [Amycolatopsis sp.]|nr:2Fe-2S iron-sulfur cluster-binding protein [Amycolatopsis sp.]
MAAAPLSHTVRVEPAGLDIEVRHGETLFDAAWREGYDWPTICLGQARCTYCHVRVRADGTAALSRVEKDEQLAIQRIARRLYSLDTSGLRLACQLRVITGDIVVEQPAFRGERRPDAQNPES